MKSRKERCKHTGDKGSRESKPSLSSMKAVNEAAQKMANKLNREQAWSDTKSFC